MNEKLLKVHEFAAQVGVSPGTIYSLVKATRENRAKKPINFVEKQRGLAPLILIPEIELEKFKNVYYKPPVKK